jgi:hypothetical protein
MVKFEKLSIAEKILYIALAPVRLFRRFLHIVREWLQYSWRRFRHWISYLRTSDVGRAEFYQKFRRIVCVITVATAICLVLFSHVYTEKKQLSDAMAKMYTIEHTVCYGESWWSIAQENCPDYMHVGGWNSEGNYLELLYSLNAELAEQDYLRVGDVVNIPIMPE